MLIPIRKFIRIFVIGAFVVCSGLSLAEPPIDVSNINWGAETVEALAKIHPEQFKKIDENDLAKMGVQKLKQALEPENLVFERCYVNSCMEYGDIRDKLVAALKIAREILSTAGNATPPGAPYDSASRRLDGKDGHGSSGSRSKRPIDPTPKSNSSPVPVEALRALESAANSDPQGISNDFRKAVQQLSSAIQPEAIERLVNQRSKIQLSPQQIRRLKEIATVHRAKDIDLLAMVEDEKNPSTAEEARKELAERVDHSPVLDGNKLWPSVGRFDGIRRAIIDLDSLEKSDKNMPPLNFASDQVQPSLILC